MKKQDLIKNSKRVVIKIGSALLIDSKTGKLQKNWLETLAFDIHNLINSGVEVIIIETLQLDLITSFWVHVFPSILTLLFFIHFWIVALEYSVK